MSSNISKFVSIVFGCIVLSIPLSSCSNSEQGPNRMAPAPRNAVQSDLDAETTDEPKVQPDTATHSMSPTKNKSEKPEMMAKKNPEAKSEVKSEPKPETKPETKPEAPKEESTEVKVPAPPVISSEGDGKIVIGPAYKQDKATEGRGQLKGTLQKFNMQGSDSVIFKGNYSRGVRVLLPPGFKPDQELPFCIGMDAQFGPSKVMETTIDNLISDKKIPPMVVISVDHGGGDSRGSQRGKEYDTVGPDNAKFLLTEVMAEVSKRYGVKFTTKPEGGCVAGISSSGVAAFTAAWFAPERFGKVLAYSPTFTAQGANQEYPEGGWEYQTHIIKETAVKPLRISIQAGEKDNNFFNSTLEANEKTYKELAAKGYHVRYHMSLGAGHVDTRAVNQTIAENLIWLWRDYPR